MDETSFSINVACGALIAAVVCVFRLNPNRRSFEMPTYVSFLKMTAEGNKEIKKSRERFELGKKAVEAAGGKVLSAYYIVSRAEYMIITEFPNETARIKSVINTLQRGNVGYEVYSMLPVEDYLKLTDEA